jgi:hypothetical protein
LLQLLMQQHQLQHPRHCCQLLLQLRQQQLPLRHLRHFPHPLLPQSLVAETPTPVPPPHSLLPERSRHFLARLLPLLPAPDLSQLLYLHLQLLQLLLLLTRVCWYGDNLLHLT